MAFQPTDEHPTIAHHVWFERLKYCGCGSPEMVLEHLKIAMRAMKERRAYFAQKPAHTGFTWTPDDQAVADREADAIGANGERYGLVFYMTGYLLAAADLTEHGGSVPGWLNEDGEALLAYLESTPEKEWLKEPWEIVE